jgi:hypothetical protein
MITYFLSPLIEKGTLKKHQMVFFVPKLYHLHIKRKAWSLNRGENFKFA